MRRAAMVLLAMFLCGCTKNTDHTKDALSLRHELLVGSGCCFLAEITADYRDELYTFTLECSADKQGDLTFCVVAPERISGISGVIDQSNGALTFDDQVLLFDTLNEEQLSPVSAPYIFLKALRSGYIRGCGVDEDLAYWRIDDSYRDQAYQVEIWVNDENVPIRGEILWNGRRILSITVKDFHIL